MSLVTWMEPVVAHHSQQNPVFSSICSRSLKSNNKHIDREGGGGGRNGCRQINPFNRIGLLTMQIYSSGIIHFWKKKVVTLQLWAIKLRILDMKWKPFLLKCDNMLEGLTLKRHRFLKCTLAGHSIGRTFAPWANVILFLQALPDQLLGLRHEVWLLHMRACMVPLRIG